MFVVDAPLKDLCKGNLQQECEISTWVSESKLCMHILRIILIEYCCQMVMINSDKETNGEHGFVHQIARKVFRSLS